MVDTPNFKITEVDPNQNDKEVTINEAFNEFEDLLSEEFADAAVTGNTTLTEANYTRNFHFVYGGTPGAPWTLTTPDLKKFFVVTNNTDDTVTVQGTASSSTVSIDPSVRKFIYHDGTDTFEFASSLNAAMPADTRFVKLILRATEVAGGDADVAFDDFSLTIAGVVPPLTVRIYQVSAQVGRGYTNPTTV